jgi:hypothetical protein
VQRRIFGPKKVGVAGGWIKPHSEEFQSHFSPNIIKIIKLARMGKMKNAIKLTVRKAEGKRHLEYHRRTWKDNIKMHIREIGLEGVNSICLAWVRE